MQYTLPSLPILESTVELLVAPVLVACFETVDVEEDDLLTSIDSL